MKTTGILTIKCDYCGCQIPQDHIESGRYKKHLNGKVECIKCFANGKHMEDFK